MASHRSLSIGNTPVLVSPEGVHSGVEVILQNQSETNNIYVGTNSGTSVDSFGLKIYPTTAISVTLGSREEMWAVSDGTVDANLMWSNP
jgi:hypothetical protein